MKKTAWFFSIFLILVHVAFGDIPKPMSPPRLVNDFIGLLSPVERDKVEQQLLDFEKITSVQIAVVIVNHTEYEFADEAQRIGEEWGVGDTILDNGVVFLIAKEDRKMFIATGYGVEADLPDAICKRITEQTVKPFFKKGEFGSGILAGVKEIIKKLGDISSDERATRNALVAKAREEERRIQEMLRKKEELRRKKEMEELFAFVGDVAIGALIFGFIAFLFYRIRRRITRGQEVGKRISELQDFYGTILQDEVVLDTKWPEWAKDEFKKFSVEYEKWKKVCDEAFKELPTGAWGRGGITDESLDKIQSDLESFEVIDSEVVKIRESVKFYEKNSPGAINQVTAMSQEIGKSLKQAEDDGFSISGLRQEFETVSGFIKLLAITDPDSHKKSYLDAFHHKEKLNSIKGKLEKEKVSKKEFDEILPGAKGMSAEAVTKIKNYGGLFSKIAEAFSFSSLAGLAQLEGFAAYPSMIAGIVDKSEKLSAEKKDGAFGSALEKLKSAIMRDAELDSALRALTERKKDLEDKRDGYLAQKSSIARKVKEAENAIDDSDVEHDARDAARKSRSEFEKAVELAEKSSAKINWLVVYGHFAKAKSAANDAIEKAEDDIRRAKNRRAEAKREESQRRSSYSSGSYGGGSYSSSSSSSSSSGGFGGFGGGSFGGGGGGSSW